jgi:HAD superfamily hydrolase (TIGR01490 family)
MEGGQGVAIFDFDGTLIRSDSLLPFLTRACGFWKTALAFGGAVCLSLAAHERRTRIKALFLRWLLKGADPGKLAAAAERLRAWVVWKEENVAALRAHRAQGHHIVIASGSLDVYLPALLRDLPYDGLICTGMERKDGRLTGAMAPPGNCVRQTKAERVRAYLAEKGPFAESWAYGNPPHDLSMMAFCDHGIIVK